MADTISTSELARACGRTPQWVRDQARAGYFESAGRGRWNTDSVFRGLVERAEAIATEGQRAVAASRATDARTREIEQRIAMRERELIPIEDAIAEYDLLVAAVRREMDSIPAAATRDLKDRRRLDRIVDAAKNRIADALAVAEKAARTGESEGADHG